MSLDWPGNASGSPLEELEEVSGVREVWASLLRLLPPCDPVPDQADENGWMDGYKGSMAKANSNGLIGQPCPDGCPLTFGTIVSAYHSWLQRLWVRPLIEKLLGFIRLVKDEHVISTHHSQPGRVEQVESDILLIQGLLDAVKHGPLLSECSADT
ncbi:hypothetical protein L3Q82_000647 [Scortum barcoo]|uniref:Uncharacterized protein n=1 Tax=Scortum barcoo TaxID=214431 RepID=A0ACB8WF96_9TELE|nr:hypothetical protein L3Q82_000647 [Scortum barcoo]